MAALDEPSKVSSFIDSFLRSPFAGIAPWVLMSVVSGPDRFEEAAAAALGLALLVLWMGQRRGISVHLLEVFGVVYFAILAVLGLVASTEAISWLELWAGELSNIALAAFAVFTLVIRRPFTLAYAKDTTPREYWEAPLFLRINYVISGVWAAAFTLAAIVGFYGDAVLRDSGNFWTGWILQLLFIFFAVQFTEFYPDYAQAKFAQAAGEPAEPPPSWSRLFDWLAPFALVTGIVGWVTESVPAVVGIGLAVVGAVGTEVVRRAVPADK